MSTWLKRTLSDLIELQRGHDLPTQDRTPGPIPIIGSFGVTGTHNAAKYAGPGVAIGRSGASIGQATFVDEPYWPLNTCLFVKNFNDNDPRWIYRLLDGIDFTAFNSGSAQPSLNRNFLRSIPVEVPPLDEQRAIAEVLGALDDKIAANTKLAAISDEWVRASQTGLITTAEETVRVSELVATRKELAEPSTLDPASRYLGLEHLPRRSMWTTAAGTAESVTSTKAKFQRGDILFGKLRPYFHKVVVAPYEGVCSTDILVLNPLNRELAGFALASVASDLAVERATAASEGTRMPRTSWKDLASIEIPWPGLTEAKEFSARVAAVRSSVESLLNENRTLASVRDCLLPQLMSGKLRVKDAEKVLEYSGL